MALPKVAIEFEFRIIPKSPYMNVWLSGLVNLWSMVGFLFLNYLLLFLSADKFACQGFSRKWDLSHCSRTGQTIVELDGIVAHVGDHMEQIKWKYHNKQVIDHTDMNVNKLLVTKLRQTAYCILNKYTTHHVAKVTGNSKQVMIGKKKRKCKDRTSSLPFWISVDISELYWYVYLIQVYYCTLFYNYFLGIIVDYLSTTTT